MAVVVVVVFVVVVVDIVFVCLFALAVGVRAFGVDVASSSDVYAAAAAADFGADVPATAVCAVVVVDFLSDVFVDVVPAASADLVVVVILHSMARV